MNLKCRCCQVVIPSFQLHESKSFWIWDKGVKEGSKFSSVLHKKSQVIIRFSVCTGEWSTVNFTCCIYWPNPSSNTIPPNATGKYHSNSMNCCHFFSLQVSEGINHYLISLSIQLQNWIINLFSHSSSGVLIFNVNYSTTGWIDDLGRDNHDFYKTNPYSSGDPLTFHQCHVAGCNMRTSAKALLAIPQSRLRTRGDRAYRRLD